MLEQARTKSKLAGLDIRFLQQDMRSLRIEPGAFDAAICLFDSIGYVITDEGFDDTVQRVRAHLKGKGLFILEYWHAPAMLGHYEPVRVRRWRTDKGEVLRISETHLNRNERSATVKYSIYELDLDGRYRHTEEAHSNRYFSVEEMCDRLTMNGFHIIENCSGYSWNEPVSKSTWHVVTIARNAQRG
jgi:SAM-dependent methyltransferase